jgi:RNA polymerase sigma-70 factor (ECF subfamily)
MRTSGSPRVSGWANGESWAALRADDVNGYQPYWVTVAQLCDRRGDRGGSRQALTRALGLAEDPAVRRYLAERLARA